MSKHILAGTATQLNYFDTYSGGIVLSTDPSGITYFGNHLFISDSEINETGSAADSGYFVGHNIFETSLDGSVVYGQYMTSPLNGSIEPTGICYNPIDGYFYITNDDTRSLYQYEFNDEGFSLLNSWKLKQELFDLTDYGIEDPEGIGVNPITGHLIIADGEDGSFGGRRILIVEVSDNSISLVDSFSVADNITDPEGVTYHENSGHLFIMSGPDRMIFEFDIEGNYIDEYDISGFLPLPRSAQGLTFAPSSADNSRLSLYFSDGGLDESPERARVYEADLGDEISLSVQLSSFNSQARAGAVNLSWETLSIHENITWAIEKRNQNNDEFVEIARLDQNANSGQGQFFEYQDTDVFPGNTYFYRLLDIDITGTVSIHQSISVSIAPESFSLAQNFPNPFNPGTIIQYNLPQDTYVLLDVYNTLGQKVQTLTNEELEAGVHQVEFNGQNFASGVYFYRIRAGAFQEVKKMILVK
jgi:hypothetical protein